MRNEYLVVQDINPINKHHLGFVKNKRTKDALKYITYMIYNNLDKNKLILITVSDLDKAFDTVIHNISLDKFYNYGIKGKMHELFRNYLTDKTQTEKIRETKSENYKITTEYFKVWFWDRYYSYDT